MQKFKVNEQSVPKIEWKQTDGQTDGGDCITSLANAVPDNATVLHSLNWTKHVKLQYDNTENM